MFFSEMFKLLNVSSNKKKNYRWSKSLVWKVVVIVHIKSVTILSELNESNMKEPTSIFNSYFHSTSKMIKKIIIKYEQLMSNMHR